MITPADITVAVLAGGLGTRLRSVVPDRPKVMAPVLGRPFLSWWLDTLNDYGFRKVVLCTGYLANQISDYCGSSYRDLILDYSLELSPLGTGGALRQALPRCDSDLILAINGDSFCDANLSTFVSQHQESGWPASLVLTQVEDTRRFGRVICQGRDRIVEFQEKSATRGAGWINAGIYLLSRRLLQAVPAGEALSLERDLLPRWISRGLHGFKCPGSFIDIGTPESFVQAAEFFSTLRPSTFAAA
jgi:NDP-sugar pyrophosphorylase family protein